MLWHLLFSALILFPPLVVSLKYLGFVHSIESCRLESEIHKLEATLSNATDKVACAADAEEEKFFQLGILLTRKYVNKTSNYIQYMGAPNKDKLIYLYICNIIFSS